jgi:mRNA-degrading endonuclease RelE of RelBE toxin-antitoxin system
VNAADVIKQIKELSVAEREQVVKFITENGDSLVRHAFSVETANDGLPIIRSNRGIITSDLVSEIESQTP